MTWATAFVTAAGAAFAAWAAACGGGGGVPGAGVAAIGSGHRASRGLGASVRPVGGGRLPAWYGSGQGAPGPA